MARALRIEFPGADYHVMSRGINRQPTFLDYRDQIDFLERLQTLIESGALILYAFVLMLNHFHLLCQTPFGELHRWIQWLLSGYTSAFNRRHDRVGGLWQGRYKAILVEDGEYFLSCSRYIHMNPVKAELVASPSDYQWSSYPVYLGTGTSLVTVNTERILGQFQRIDDYRAYVETDDPLCIVNPLDAATAGVAFGSEAFVERIRTVAEDCPESPEIPSLRGLLRTRPLPDLRTLESAIELSFSDFSRCQRGRLMVYCLTEFSWLTQTEIARSTDRSVSSVSKVAQQISERVASDPSLKLRLSRLYNQLFSSLE